MIASIMIFPALLVVLVALGNPRDWRQLNRWSLLMYSGLAVGLALESFSIWLTTILTAADYNRRHYGKHRNRTARRSHYA